MHMRVAVKNHALPVFKKNRIALLLCIFETIIFAMFTNFVCFVALHPKSTAMVMVGQSVHLTTLLPGQA